MSPPTTRARLRPPLLVPLVRAALLAAAFAGEARAQVIRGSISDGDTGGPITQATLTLLDSAERSGRVAGRSDSTGRFAVIVPEPGFYRLRITRLGYSPHTSLPLLVRPGDTVNVSYSLRGSARRLEAVRVTAQSLARSPEFAARLKRGNGRIWTSDQLEERGYFDIPAALYELPSARLTYEQGRYTLTLRGNQVTRCQVSFFLNGRVLNPMGRGTDEAMETIFAIPIELVTALEVYSDLSQMPGEFRDYLNCAAIAVWTKRPS